MAKSTHGAWTDRTSGKTIETLLPREVGDILEVRINKEVRDYQESLFFGLSLRQFLFALLAVAVAVGVYFGLHTVVGNADVGWLCVLAAFPFAICGFFRYNGILYSQYGVSGHLCM